MTLGSWTISIATLIHFITNSRYGEHFCVDPIMFVLAASGVTVIFVVFK